ncbi:uncharacterized protein MONBRDRAFT_22828 [Monosiga brevicollis MX1]|uniref:Uncharacterized protein n=1 Tax=Monosiga brevicollis TaxID=81824 RepID=A9US74_MONBE|nr:uncharacterized protein MONBRDRAFT_22828 [Monosiga brevicollis MX1]EDQ91730.1 predicted protein [Monosiga brevicollis MX1]|eukprot:XP_001743016.1 hypothetical protein [Monosiga brevicollis MX1]
MSSVSLSLSLSPSLLLFLSFSLFSLSLLSLLSLSLSLSPSLSLPPSLSLCWYKVHNKCYGPHQGTGGCEGGVRTDQIVAGQPAMENMTKDEAKGQLDIAITSKFTEQMAAINTNSSFKTKSLSLSLLLKKIADEEAENLQTNGS